MGRFQVRREFEDLMLETIDISVFSDLDPDGNLLLVQELEEEVISDTNLSPSTPPSSNHVLYYLFIDSHPV